MIDRLLKMDLKVWTSVSARLQKWSLITLPFIITLYLKQISKLIKLYSFQNTFSFNLS